MIGWAVDGGGYGRKLASVRFFTVQYQQHLERLFALEEIDGYMESVSLYPDLTNQMAFRTNVMLSRVKTGSDGTLLFSNGVSHACYREQSSVFGQEIA